MLRRARAASCTQSFALRISACDKTTGFSVFTSEVQKKVHILKASSLGNGKSNMVVMSYLWNQLSKRERDRYNEVASKRDCFRVRSAAKQNNQFNLIMRLFARNGVILGAGDEKFVTMLAKKTSSLLPKESIQDICRVLQVSPPFSLAASPSSPLATSLTCTNASPHDSRRRPPSSSSASSPATSLDPLHDAMLPHMKYFSSFTEMQRAVAPTRLRAYIAVCKSLAPYTERQTHDARMQRSFHALRAEEQHTFAPITDAEASAFETFCAQHAAPMNPHQFDISRLFAQFRGMATSRRCNARAASPREQLYRSLMAEDKAQDGLYSRVRRTLQRISAQRSSDAGLYLLPRMPLPRRAVPPSMYALQPCINEVAVSTLLAMTRQNCCVYDDVLQRAAVLRPREAAAALEARYGVADAVTVCAVRRAAAAPVRCQVTFTAAQLKAAMAVALTKSKEAAQRKCEPEQTTVSTPQEQRVHTARDEEAATRTRAMATTKTKTRTAIMRARPRRMDVAKEQRVHAVSAAAVPMRKMTPLRVRRLRRGAPARRTHATSDAEVRVQRETAPERVAVRPTSRSSEVAAVAAVAPNKVPFNVQSIRNSLMKMQPDAPLIIKLVADTGAKESQRAVVPSAPYARASVVPGKRGPPQELHPHDTFAAELRAQLAAVL